jgi:hypothetical protein
MVEFFHQLLEQSLPVALKMAAATAAARCSVIAGLRAMIAIAKGVHSE